MRKAWMVTLLVFAIATSITFADEATHKEAALKLLEVTNTQKMLDQYMTSFETMMEKQFDALELPSEGREAAKALQKEMMEWLSGFLAWEQMKDTYVDIYVEVFTEDELNELIEFYQSPLGQKLLKKMPELLQKTMQKTQAILQEKMPDFQRKLQKTLSELKEKYKE